MQSRTGVFFAPRCHNNRRCALTLPCVSTSARRRAGVVVGGQHALCTGRSRRTNPRVQRLQDGAFDEGMGVSSQAAPASRRAQAAQATCATRPPKRCSRWPGRRPSPRCSPDWLKARSRVAQASSATVQVKPRSKAARTTPPRSRGGAMILASLVRPPTPLPVPAMVTICARWVHPATRTAAR